MIQAAQIPASGIGITAGRSLRILCGALGVVCGLALGTGAAADTVELAARGDLWTPPIRDLDSHPSSERVRRIQTRLTAAGFYKGPIDGVAGPATEDAIRAYQEAKGLTVNGRISDELEAHLETAPRVRKLQEELKRTRKAGQDAARRALAGQGATRDLVENPDNSVADPTRDPSPCFRTPTPRCLLTEAAESAKAIANTEIRDWAFGELVAAQARSGLSAEAMDNVRRIEDPRLILVALRDVARARAASGDDAGAWKAAAIIPDATRRAEALDLIAEEQVKRRDSEGVVETSHRQRALLSKLSDVARAVTFEAAMALHLYRIGEMGDADSIIDRAGTQAAGLHVDDDRALAFSHIAATLADMDRIDSATALLKRVPAGHDRTPALMAIAVAQARLGDFPTALNTTRRIGSARYRAVAVGRIAVLQAEREGTEIGLETARKALDEARHITLPYARAYAISHTALAMLDIGRRAPAAIDEAAAAAKTIGDKRLRAHAFWMIAAECRRHGNGADAERMEGLARAATARIESPLNRVWMFGNIAADRSAAGEPDAARTAFDNGLREAARIHDAWTRTRVLTKLGATLAELSSPRPSTAPRFRP